MPPSTAEEYLMALPEERRAALQAVRETILASLPEGYEEGIQYGMIGYFVPHHLYPPGYHVNPKEPLPFLALASQKNHMAIYAMGIYVAGEEETFRAAWAATGKKLDMGKCCIRFKKVEQLALDVIQDWIRKMPPERLIAAYEASRKGA